MSYTPLPIGFDDFETVIKGGYYYVDKTWLIKELLDRTGQVNLFTRPRRFGKTLNLSMLKYFFENPIDGKSRSNLFDGLKIMDAGDRYTRRQERYPVIMLTLKSAKQPDFKMAYASMIDDIGREYARHNRILQSEEISREDKEKFIRIRDRKAEPIDYAKSLLFLSQCLYAYYREKTIILIDEYDVPLENAYYGGFYDEMIGFIRSLFESALKSNPYLEFSVITGCLRISKESIFTGMNNLKIISILNEDYGEYFGFTEEEVRKMLHFYGREHKMDTVKKWYDGYRFGKDEVYNPWSVINYVDQLVGNENAFPVAAWSNTSSNSIVKDLIYRASDEVKAEIEMLTNAGTIEKKVHEDITYEDIYESEDNLWNFLFFTGYLKQTDIRMDGLNRYVTMAIPNNELFYIYENTIDNWFRDEVKEKDLSGMYTAMLSGDAKTFEEELGSQLQNTISYMDGGESFYHGFLLGILANLDYIKRSNRESGTGRYDILVYKHRLTIPPVVLELKVAGRYKELDSACEAALAQIAEKTYYADLAEDGYREVICYGVAFYKKQVRIHVRRKELEG